MSETAGSSWFSDQAEEKAQALHARYLQGDVTARSELAELVIGPLQERLQRTNGGAIVDDIEDACVTAFVDYMQNPAKYDPARSKLHAYLLMAARRDLMNLLDKHKRRAKHETEMPTRVALDGGESEEEMEFTDGETTEETVLLNLRSSELGANVARRYTDPIDRQCYEMWVDGVHETEQYAEVLGITHLPIEEQRVLVKRRNDRIRVAARRHAAELLADAEQIRHD